MTPQPPPQPAAAPTLSLGFSPCPNDCFIFYALVHGKVAPDVDWDVRLEDVETLNKLARAGALMLSKLSYHAYGHLAKDYVMLRSGGALGRGVGPLLVSKARLDSLRGKRVAVPGGLTTAKLLLELWQPGAAQTTELRYEHIMPAVARGEVDAGLIIHESRFTFLEHGLHKVVDLGQWWEEATGLPIPLGGIAAKRALGRKMLLFLEEAVRASLAYAWAHDEETRSYVAAHAQEMAPEVREKHIGLYVNAFSEDVGDQGEAAVRTLFERARAQGLMPPLAGALFV